MHKEFDQNRYYNQYYQGLVPIQVIHHFIRFKAFSFSSIFLIITSTTSDNQNEDLESRMRDMFHIETPSIFIIYVSILNNYYNTKVSYAYLFQHKNEEYYGIIR